MFVGADSTSVIIHKSFRFQSPLFTQLAQAGIAVGITKPTIRVDPLSMPAAFDNRCDRLAIRYVCASRQR